MTKMTRHERLIDLQARERKLSAEIADSQKMIDAVDGNRIQMEDGMNTLHHSATAIEGQQRVLKERQSWLIKEQDKLKAEITKVVKEIGKMTRPGDSR